MTQPRAFSLRHKLLIAGLGAIILLVSLLAAPTSPALTQAVPVAEAATETATDSNTGSPEDVTPPAQPDEQHDGQPGDNTLARTVQPGDTLSEIFQSSNVPLSDLRQIIKADTEYLDLETLRPGTELTLTFNPDGNFAALELRLDPARKVAYTKQSDGSFEYRKYEADTRWVSEVIRGRITGSFYASAVRSGLTRAQVLLIDQLLGSKLDFSRDLRVGDTFSVMVGHELIGPDSTGNTRLDAIALNRRNTTLYAFRFDDGNYYDENGDSVSPAFLRWPTSKRYRVSSPFNRNRLHPVTGRRRPHNGVDLATPIGTPVLSTGDGIVRRVGNHPYAGKYIDIDHGGSHTTRYLHLSKVLVGTGAQIRRGQQIARSGNTGRSTGPHLHFEFHIKGRPVNPLTANIPTAASVPAAEAARFAETAEQQMAVMTHAASRSELLLSEAPSLFE